MPNTPYLNVAPVSAGQNNKEITINDAELALEQATQVELAVDFTSGDVTLTVAQFTRNMSFGVTNLAADHNLIVPTNMGAGSNTGRRFFVVRNPSTHRVTVKTSAGTGFTVPQETNALCYMDGTNVYGVIAGAADTRHFDLSFFFPGDLISSQTMVRWVASRNVHWNVDVGGSQAVAASAPAGGDVQLLLKKNGLVIGSIDFTDGTSIGTFSHPTATDWAPGDVLEIDTQADVFAINGVSVSIAGYLN